MFRSFLAMLVTAMVVPAVALAAVIPVGTPMPTRILPVGTAPIALQKCKLDKDGMYANSWAGNVVVGNRTKHVLSTARVVFVAYDVENTRMDQESRDFDFSEPVASADSSSAAVNINFAGNPVLIARVTCRVQSASFSANKRWQYGQSWKEPLVRLNAEPTADAGGEGPLGQSPAREASTAVRPAIIVTNAWNDVVNGVTYVHAALTVTARESAATLRASDLQIVVTLRNGGRKTYAALLSGAPTYQKMNPLGSGLATAYEVQPSEDLGLLGATLVPAHGEAHVVATFAIPDALANPNDNRAVSLR